MDNEIYDFETIDAITFGIMTSFYDKWHGLGYSSAVRERRVDSLMFRHRKLLDRMIENRLSDGL